MGYQQTHGKPSILPRYGILITKLGSSSKKIGFQKKDRIPGKTFQLDFSKVGTLHWVLLRMPLKKIDTMTRYTIFPTMNDKNNTIHSLLIREATAKLLAADRVT
jgi:hypothetical protein